MKNRIELKAKEIADAIYDHINNCNENDLGLFNQTMGMILFLSYYNRLYKSHESEVALDNLIDKSFDKISGGVFNNYTYCAGLSGTFFGMSFIQNRQLLNIDISEAREYYDNSITSGIISDINKSNNDFLYGVTGVVAYLLKYRYDTIPYIIKYLDYLEDTGISENDSIKWSFIVNTDGKKTFSIGMAHGMSSIVILLTRILNRGIEQERVIKLLSQTINYILKQEIDHYKYNCYFPSHSIECMSENFNKSRLGWCYGDLGVAIALWSAGVALNNNDWKDKAIEVIEFSASRRELKGNYVVDAGICHGTAGIAQIFKRIYLETGNEIFAEANRYWINETLKMSKFNDGIAGYRIYTGNEETEMKWEMDYSFLEGISGIGLALLASIGDESYSDWDEILLLSDSIK